MTVAMRAVAAPSAGGARVLRVGVVRDGHIVEERTLPRRGVTVGSSERNDFVVPEVSARFELFQLVGGEYVLNFTAAMTGRVGLAGQTRDLAELRSSGSARDAGAHHQVKLHETARGRVSIGATTFLFQLVPPPPVRTRPALPAAVRGGFVKGVDWMFTAVAITSYALFFGFVVYLESADFPAPQGIAGIPDDFHRFIFEAPEPPPPDPSVDPVAPDPAPVAHAPDRTPTRPAPDRAPTRTPSDSAPAPNDEARAAIAREASASAQALVLGALGPNGALANVLENGAPTGNVADVLAQARGVEVASSGAAAFRPRGGTGSGRTDGIGNLVATRDGSLVPEGAPVEEVVIRPLPMPDRGDVVGGGGQFDPELVTRMIRSRRSAFQRCYETALHRTPTIDGKVEVEFTLEESGAVSNAEVTENNTGDEPLGTCVAGVIGRLRWPVGPTGGSMSFSYPFVFAPQR